MRGAKSVPRLLSGNTPTVRLVTYETGAKCKCKFNQTAERIALSEETAARFGEAQCRLEHCYKMLQLKKLQVCRGHEQPCACACFGMQDSKSTTAV